MIHVQRDIVDELVGLSPIDQPMPDRKDRRWTDWL